MRRVLLLFFGLTVILMLNAVSFGENSDKIDLRLNLEKGRSFVHRITADLKVVQDFPGKRFEMTQTTRCDISQEVLMVDESGNADIRIVYKSVYVKQQSPLGTFEYDSANPPRKIPPEAGGFAALAGARLTARLSPKGEILQVQGLKELLAKMFKNLKYGEGSIRDELIKMCDKEDSKESLRMMYGIYPGRPVGVGDIWINTEFVNRFFPMIIQNYYKLADRRDGKIIFTFKSVLRSDPDAEQVKLGAATLTFDISGRQNGTMEINEADGIVTKADATMAFSGSIKAEGIPGAAPSVSWPLEMEGTVHIEMIQ